MYFVATKVKYTFTLKAVKLSFTFTPALLNDP